MIALGGLQIAHPVLNASGTLDALSAHAVLGDASLGCAAHVTKTITPLAREGNPAPRITEISCGLLNSIGLPGPGIDRFCAEVLPATAAIVDVPIVVSIGGFSIDDYALLADRLSPCPAAAAIELNLSCPNVKTGCLAIGSDVGETEAVTAAVRARFARPLFVKLAPGLADLASIARAAVAGGADALTLTNTARGMAMHRGTGEPLLGARTGGVSGPALRPQALAAVDAARAAVDIAIVGVGGIETADDARDYLAAGATAVAVGTAIFPDPGAPRRIAAGLVTP